MVGTLLASLPMAYIGLLMDATGRVVSFVIVILSGIACGDVPSNRTVYRLCFVSISAHAGSEP